MKIIPKENVFIYVNKGIHYCIDKKENALLIEENLHLYRQKPSNIFLCDIAVNERNEIHSFNDKPALVYKTYPVSNPDSENSKTFIWFQNGKRGRGNKEKPYYIQKHNNKRNSKYYIMENEGFRSVNYFTLRINLKKLA
jgi:hypothetical protein